MERMHILNEIIRSIHNILYDISLYQYDLKWLLNQDTRKKIFEKNPKCILRVMNQRGVEIPLLPVCNRMGSLDARLVKFSMMLASRLQNHNNIDQNHLMTVIHKLKFLHKKLQKQIVKPSHISNEKRRVTKFINNLL